MSCRHLWQFCLREHIEEEDGSLVIADVFACMRCRAMEHRPVITLPSAEVVAAAQADAMARREQFEAKRAAERAAWDAKSNAELERLRAETMRLADGVSAAIGAALKAKRFHHLGQLARHGMQVLDCGEDCGLTAERDLDILAAATVAAIREQYADG